MSKNFVASNFFSLENVILFFHTFKTRVGTLLVPSLLFFLQITITICLCPSIIFATLSMVYDFVSFFFLYPLFFILFKFLDDFLPLKE